jgi:anti-sigma-K factor RskA
MKRYQHPAVIEHLASAYVAGTLHPATRRRLEALMQKNTPLALEVDAWSERLAPLFERLPAQKPSAALWAQIEQRTVAPPAAPQKTASQKWWSWLSPLPLANLMVGLVLGLVALPLWHTLSNPAQEAQLPASYAGVLGTADGKPGLVVSSLRHGMQIDVRQITPVAVPAGQTLYLWRLDAQGVATAIGPLANGKWVQTPLAEPAEKVFFTAVELAVSLEPMGSKPTAPTGAFVYRGLCGKLWKP